MKSAVEDFEAISKALTEIEAEKSQQRLTSPMVTDENPPEYSEQGNSGFSVWGFTVPVNGFDELGY